MLTIYSPDKILSTYKKVIIKANKLLLNNKNVIIDATFQKNKYREMVNKLAEELNIIPIFIQCIAPDIMVKTWLKERMKTKSVSDGRWEIYKSMKKNFEQFTYKKNLIFSDFSPIAVRRGYELQGAPLTQPNQ